MINILNKYHDDGLVQKQVHPTLPLIIWNYTPKVQYESLWDDITLQARGLVTDVDGNVIARPMNKFFNLEEGKHTPTSEFEVFTKMDGSLGIIFHYNNEWVIATRGSFTSDQSVRAYKIFNQYVSKYGDHKLDKNLTYLVEILFKENRIVVDYGDFEGLILLSVTNTDGELDHDMFNDLWFHEDLIVKKHDGLEDYTTLKSIIGNNEEGFVIKFSNGERVKIKGDEYLRLHKIMTNVSTTSIWEVVSNGNSLDHLLADVPDEFYSKMRDYEKTLHSKFNTIKNEANDLFVRFMCDKDGTLLNKKDYAMWVLKQPLHLQPILFKMFDKKEYYSYIWKMIKPEFQKI